MGLATSPPTSPSAIAEKLTYCMKSWMGGSPAAMAVRFITYPCGRGKPLSVQSSAWSEKVASTEAEREPVKVRTPLSGE